MNSSAVERRCNNIDGLRAISCMAIVAVHLYYLADYSFPFVESFIGSFVDFVIVFMILSGYGICHGYLEKFNNNQINIENFYYKRYSKILPFFFVITIIGVVYEHSFKGFAEGIMELTLLFGLLPNNSNVFSVNGVCWTLGVIFVFYLIFPFLSILLKTKKRAWCSFTVFLIIHILCVTLFMTEEYVVSGFLNNSSILYSAIFFFSGGLVYLYKNDIKKLVGKHSIITVILCLIITVLLILIPNEILGFGISDQKYFIGGIIWLLYAVGVEKSVLSNKFFLFISRYSMEIYLSHMIILKVLCIFKTPSIIKNSIVSYCVMFIVLIGLTLLFDIVIKCIIEKAVSIVKRKFI